MSFVMKVDFRPHKLVQDKKIDGGYIWLGGHTEISNPDGTVEVTETIWNVKATYDPNVWKIIGGLIK